MGYRCSFMDNEVYSAQDVNERIACMFTEGVSIVDSENILAGLNEATKDIATSGVLPDSCKVERTATGYKITKGSAIMPDGSCITFDDEGYEFTAEYGVMSYVYLRRKEPYNRIDVVVSADSPDDDCVSLAVINGEGNVQDRRKYALLKVRSMQESTLRTITKSYSGSNYYESETFDMGTGNFTYVALLSGVIINTSGKIYASKKDIIEIVDGEEVEMILLSESGATCGILSMRKNGRYIDVWFYSYDRQMDYELTIGVI